MGPEGGVWYQWEGTTPPPELQKRAVRILLEFILVFMLDLSDMQSNVLNSTQTQRIFVALSISVAKTDVTVCVKKGYILFARVKLHYVPL